MIGTDGKYLTELGDKHNWLVTAVTTMQSILSAGIERLHDLFW
jgi:hypothetical protein